MKWLFMVRNPWNVNSPRMNGAGRWFGVFGVWRPGRAGTHFGGVTVRGMDSLLRGDDIEDGQTVSPRCLNVPVSAQAASHSSAGGTGLRRARSATWRCASSAQANARHRVIPARAGSRVRGGWTEPGGVCTVLRPPLANPSRGMHRLAPAGANAEQTVSHSTINQYITYIMRYP
jgi:hypothetical protein